MGIITKAVFPVAGFGTRFLPATKAMPKELLPIVDKPLIQYAVEEAISAEIDTLIFVTGRHKRSIEDHFDSNYELEAALVANGMHEKAEMVRNILPVGVECVFVRQPQPLGLGHAVLCAERVVGDEPFAVLLADDFIISPGAGVTSELTQAFEANGKTQLSTTEINGPNISKYGVVVPSDEHGGVAGLLEKPTEDEAPSNKVSLGRYILTPDIFEILRKQPLCSSGEIQLADAINTQAARGRVGAIPLHGKRFDCGSVEGYLDAIIHIAEERRQK